MLSPSAREQIRAASDIVEVIGAVLPLKRAGANFVALCPFHQEKTPSFHVNPQRQIFHCFGCQKGGDVFAFVQDYENVEFMEAVRRLAQRAGIPLELTGATGDAQGRFLKESLLNLHEQITRHWQQVLAQDPAGQPARDYLAKRGVPPQAVQLFRLGAAPEAWDDTVNWARLEQLEPALVEQAGLIIRQEGADRYYDRFRGRLMFPICDEQGRVIGFSGRILGGDSQNAKYVNSPETPIFTKGKVIYGLDKSRRALLDTQRAVICEGQLDLIACFQAGVTNVVAPQGTALTADHARILKRYVSEVVLCFDADAAGQKATVRVLDELLASGLAIRVAQIPAPHDPDSFIREAGGPAFQRVIEQAAGFFDYYLDRLCHDHDPTTDRGRLAITQSMAEAVHKTGHAVWVDTYAQKTAQRLGVALEAMRSDFERVGRSRKGAPPVARAGVEKTGGGPALPRPAPLEFWLLKLVCQEGSDLEEAAVRWDPAWVQHAAVREWVGKRLADPAQPISALLGTVTDPAAQALFAEALFDSRAIPEPARQLLEVMTRLRNQHLDRQRSALLRQLSQPGLPDAERDQLVRQRQALLALKHQPLSPLAES